MTTYITLQDTDNRLIRSKIHVHIDDTVVFIRWVDEDENEIAVFNNYREVIKGYIAGLEQNGYRITRED